MFTDNVRFLSGGLFISKGAWKHPRRVIDTNELIFNVKNEFSLTEGENLFTLKKHDAILLESGLVHSGVSFCENVSFYWFHFSGSIPPGALPKTTSFAEPHRILLLCRQLLHYANTPSYPHESSDCIMRLILIELYALNGDKNKGCRLVSDAEEYIRMNRARNLKAAEAAEHFGYNRDHLSRLFLRYTGMTLKEYIDETRLRYIRELLLDETLTLSQIASQSGFYDYKYFLKFFSRRESMSPTVFRELYRNTHWNDH